VYLINTVRHDDIHQWHDDTRWQFTGLNLLFTNTTISRCTSVTASMHIATVSVGGLMSVQFSALFYWQLHIKRRTHVITVYTFNNVCTVQSQSVQIGAYEISIQTLTCTMSTKNNADFHSFCQLNIVQISPWIVCTQQRHRQSGNRNCRGKPKFH